MSKNQPDFLAFEVLSKDYTILEKVQICNFRAQWVLSGILDQSMF